MIVGIQTDVCLLDIYESVQCFVSLSSLSSMVSMQVVSYVLP